MITRWTFYFDQDNLRSNVKVEAENLRIAQFIQDNPKGLLRLTITNQDDIYVNLDMVKCIACQVVTEEQLKSEQEKAPVVEEQDELDG